MARPYPITPVVVLAGRPAGHPHLRARIPPEPIELEKWVSRCSRVRGPGRSVVIRSWRPDRWWVWLVSRS